LTEPPTTAGEQEETSSDVLLAAPRDVAERLEGFLRSHGIPCRIRPKDGSDDWEVLVGPERPEEEREPAPPPDTVAADTSDVVAGPTEPVVLCELPWEQAWKLTERLIAAGIPAAVMAGEGGDRDKPMQSRTVPVGVRPPDLERARSFVD
jgi:hypothetical protein